MGNPKRHTTLYVRRGVGFPRKKDWTYEPYENFSEGAHDKLRAFHEKNPNAPRDYRLQDHKGQDSGQGPASPPDEQEQGQAQGNECLREGKEKDRPRDRKGWDGVRPAG
jgi:hypothetical protein